MYYICLENLAGEIPTEVLPTLEIVLIEKSQLYGPVSEAFQNFTAKRQLSCHPIAVSDWEHCSQIRYGPVFQTNGVNRIRPVNCDM